jgi:methylated-DNA-protein-cysteine methyltransferase-like protein
MVASAQRHTQKAMATNKKPAIEKDRVKTSLKNSASEDSSNEKPARPIEADRTTQDTPVYRERVYEIVRRIPSGRVMTYGQIALMLGEGYTPRTVGFVMHAADEERTPWQRVINAQGACSTGRVIVPPDKQQRMLEAEGIEFDAKGRCDLGRYRWPPLDEDAATSGKDDDEQPSLFSE